jgi:hypothetical protein
VVTDVFRNILLPPSGLVYVASRIGLLGPKDGAKESNPIGGSTKKLQKEQLIRVHQFIVTS